jgi:hypothetical protein
MADVVTLHLWGVAPSRVPLALLRMAIDRPLLARQPATFTRLLGTGHGRLFTPQDADPTHWAVLATWEDRRAADDFDRSPTVTGWRRIAREELRLVLKPVSSRGRWAGHEPFSVDERARNGNQRNGNQRNGNQRNGNQATAGPVASITRARIRPTLLRRFNASVPAVASDLRDANGLLLGIGIGELPVGLQGTLSIWKDADSLQRFAYRGQPHAEAVRRTAELGWYSEELFARFTVLSAEGTHRGRPLTTAGAPR